jgi:ApbE superfamily uncharacterized protein (UPF0280 family)
MLPACFSEADAMKYEERKYREWVRHDDLVAFRVMEEETDLMVSSDVDLSAAAAEAVSRYRQQLKGYIIRDNKFATALEPVWVMDDAPDIVKEMAKAARIVGVGPMASVAGAMAERVGEDLLSHSRQIIVENGGDVFIKTASKRLLGIYAADSPFTGKLALQIEPDQTPLGICTSSGTVGHSLSFGKADAAIVLSKWTALADAAATATGNLVKSAEDIQEAVEFARAIEGIVGVIVIVGDKIGAWGDVEIARIQA